MLLNRLCTLYFLGEAFQNKQTLYKHRYVVPDTDEGIKKLFDKIKSSDYMPALCEDYNKEKCSRAVYGKMPNGLIVRKTQENKDQLTETYRSNFVMADVIVIDCDGKITIDEFKKIAEPYHYFLITTRSHGIKEGDHFRVGFPLDEEIKSESKYLEYLNTVIELCKGDKSCTDSVRMFFASGSKALYDYHKGKSIMEYLKAREGLLSGESLQDEMNDPKTLDHWYGNTEEELRKHFETVDEGSRNAHLFGATGHLIFALNKSEEETLQIIEECNAAFSKPKNWREEKPKILDAIDIWKKRTQKIKEEQQKPENEFALHDIDLARFFAREIRNTFRWCEEHEYWYHYNKGVWAKDYGLNIYDAVKKAVRKRVKLGEEKLKKIKDDSPDKKALKKKYKEALKKLLSFPKRNTIIKDTKDLVPIFAKEFDAHDMLLNFKNGTLDLETFEFHDHNFEEFHTKSVDCNYDPESKTPEIFLKFLEEIFENNFELIEYIQKIFGYCLTGKISKQEFYILHGEGQNGKSVLISIFTKLMSEYVYTTDAEKLMSNPYVNKDTYLALFKNKRALFCFEGGERKRLDVPLIKLLTGGESFTVAQKYERPETFALKLKPFLITNPKPEISGTDFAIWRRVRLIPFSYKVPDEKKIDDFEYVILNAGRSGIFNWFLEGLRKYNKDGLKMPKVVCDNTDEYKEESDEIKLFLEECCELNEESSESLTAIFETYLKWSTRPKYFQHNRNSLSLELKRKGLNSRIATAKRCTYFIGIKLSAPTADHKNDFMD